MQKVNIGVVGCGNICGAYIQYAKTFPILNVVAFADLEMARAQQRAKEHGPPAKAMTVEQLLADPTIAIVVNLTIPKAHAEVNLRAIEAGKHVYVEKPLGVSREEGRRQIEAAKRKGVRIGCAPDTFLGAGLQTCRKLVDEGAIGTVVAGTAFMMCAGHEGWHPSPEFYYKAGGGPMFDMGPYYLTALVQLLGPIESLCGFARITRPTRTIGSQPLKGTVITVQTPDHVAGTLQFQSGAIVTMVTSFAVPVGLHPPITIFGTGGTLAVPDPNVFDGGVKIRQVGQKEWQEVPFTHRTGYGRAVGVADMAYAIQSGREHRASGEQAMHVLDAMQGFLDTAASGKTYKMTVPYERTAALPVGLAPGELDH